MDPQQAMVQQAMMMLMQQGGGSMQPQPQALFRAWNHPPIIGGIAARPSQIFDLSGIPGFSGNSSVGMLTGMLMQGVLPGLMGPNFVPGQFAPTQNYFDHRFALNQFSQQRRAMERASEAEYETYFRMLRGMSRMAGIEWEPGGRQEQAAERFSRDIATMMPTLATFLPPDLLDSMHGVRGSRMLMAQSVFQGGRYTFDPVSGRLGMSGESAAAVSNSIYNTLYGPTANIANMRGLGAGRAGQMYDEMIRRGYGPSTFLDDTEAQTALRRELTRPESEIASPEMRQLRRQLMTRQGITADASQAEIQRAMGTAISAFQGADPQAFETAMRSFDGARAARSIRDMAGAVSAMRDIFGDMGRPNAPMVELLNGIQAMTQGGMSHMRPAQIEQSVRQTYALARYTGMGLEVAQGFAGTANQVLQQLNLPVALAPGIAQQMMAHGFAYGRRERPVGMGIFDPEMATQVHARLLGQATASPMATRLAAFMQLRDTNRLPDGSTGFREGTEAAAMAAAIERGEPEYEFRGTDGRQTRRSVFQSMSQMQTVLQGTGVTPHAFTIAAMSPAATMAPTIQQYNLGTMVQANQGQLDSPDFIRTMSGAVSASLGSTGNVARNRRGALAQTLGSAIYEEAQRLAETDPDLLSDNRRGDLFQALQQRITTRFADRPQVLAGLDSTQLQSVIGDVWRTTDSFIPRSRWAGYSTTANWFTQHRRDIGRMRERTMAETRGIAQFQQAMSAIGQQGLTSRVSDYLQDVGPGGGTFQDFIFRAIGGLPTGEVATAASAMVEYAAGLQQQMEDARTRFARDPRQLEIEQRRIMGELQALSPDINALLQPGLPGAGPPRLSEAAREIVRRYQERNANTPAGPGGAQGPMTPADPRIRQQQQRAADLQTTYNTRRTAAIEGRGDVTEARGRHTTAQGDVSRAQAQLNTALNTPDVQRARSLVEDSQRAVDALNAQIADATRPGSTVPEARVQDLIRQRNAAQDVVRGQQAQLETQITRARESEPAQAAQRLLNEAQGRMTTAAADLARARERAGPEADNAPEVRAAQGQMNQAFTELNLMRRRAGLPDAQPLTPQQVAAERARAEYRSALDTALERLAPVQEARQRRDAANTRLTGARETYARLTNTPEVNAARDELAAAQRRVSTLRDQIAEAQSDTSPEGRRRMQTLQTQLGEAQTAVNQAHARYSGPQGAMTQLLARNPEAARAAEAVTREEGLLATEQRNFETVVGQQRPNVESNPQVRAARLNWEAAQRAAGISMSGPAGAQTPTRPDTPPMPGQMRPGMPGQPGFQAGLGVGGMQAGAVQQLQINAARTTIPDAHVDLTAANVTMTVREPGLDAISTTNQPVSADAMPDAVTGATSSQRITGTLRMEGDTATIDATGTIVDARSPRFTA